MPEEDVASYVVGNWRQRIVADWPYHPQNSHKCRDALRVLEECLVLLASLGHPLHVEEGFRAAPLPEFPKAMFHLYQGGRIFGCQADIDEAGPDWYETMDAARHAAGVTKGNQRGGIFDRALPAMPFWTAEQKLAEKAAEEEADRLAAVTKRQFVEEMRAVHRANGQIISSEKRNAREV